MNRLTALRASMSSSGIGFLLLAGKEDIFYLSGFSGSRALALVTLHSALLFVDFRYREQAERQAPEWEAVASADTLLARLRDEMSAAGTDKVYFEPSGMGYAEYAELAGALAGCELLPTDHLVRRLRAVKDAGEVEFIAQAQHLAEVSYIDVVAQGLCGRVERQLATALDCAMLLSGADKPAFDTIVSAGPRSSMPHAVAGDDPVERNDGVVIDWGARWRYYNSDATRTPFCGRPDPRLEKIYDIVLQAQLLALEAAGPGLACCELDRIAREYIGSKGYGEQFGHGLGHGVGLEVHELPVLNPSSRDILQPGMVVTVEPGIYLPGVGGVRIEDLIVITESGHRNLTGLSKDNLFMDAPRIIM